MATDKIPADQHPVYGFRPRRRQAMNMNASRVKTSIVRVHDEDLDWINWSVETVWFPGEENRSTFTIFTEHIDRNGEGRLYEIPSPVAMKIFDQMTALMKEAKSGRAKRAAATRKRKAQEKK